MNPDLQALVAVVAFLAIVVLAGVAVMQVLGGAA